MRSRVVQTKCRKPDARVAVLVPAYNEADVIVDTLQCLQEQDYPDFDVFVLCDNCTDNTKEKVIENSDYYVFETRDNDHKKAGALNQGWRRCAYDYEYVMTMDADTILQPDFISNAVQQLDENEEIGGICSRFFAKNTDTFVGKLQRLEYARYDERRMLKDFWVPVLSGTAVMYRNEALHEVYDQHDDQTGPWDIHSLVEDYKLTLELKHNGWKARAGKDLKVITDNPNTWSGLWTQRLRWTRGTVDHMKEFGYTHATKEDFWDQAKGVLFMTFKVFWIAILVMLAVISVNFQWHWIWAAPIVALWIDRMTSLYTLEDRNWKDYVISFLVLPDELIYQTFREAWYLRSYYLSFTNSDQSWR